MSLTLTLTLTLALALTHAGGGCGGGPRLCRAGGGAAPGPAGRGAVSPEWRCVCVLGVALEPSIYLEPSNFGFLVRCTFSLLQTFLDTLVGRNATARGGV